MSRRVEAWEVTVGMSLHYKRMCKPAQGIVTAVRDMSNDRVIITLTSGCVECSRSAIFELVEFSVRNISGTFEVK